ncbi:MAG: MotA/TolQ/ExbB proton channel family protein [Candidatus Omnitrophota bacterium]
MGRKIRRKDALRLAGLAILSVMVLITFTVMAKDAEPVTGTKGMTFWQICVAGGWTMIFIGLCSVLGMALVIDLFISLRKPTMMPEDYLNAVKIAIKNNDMQGATNLGSLRKGFLVNVVQSGIDKSGHELQIIQDSMTIVGAKEAAGLLQKIGYLSSIGTITPMLGLLGTVLGMIQSFNVIAFEAGLGKPTLLAAGVSQALITTAFGLIVGIPVMAFFFYFRNKAQEIITDVEITTGEIALMLAGKSKG